MASSLSVLPETLLWLSVLTDADAGDLRVLCGRSYLDGVEMAEVVLGEDVPDSFRVLELNSDVVGPFQNIVILVDLGSFRGQI